LRVLTQEELPVIDELFQMNADQLCRRYVGSLACLNHSEWESNLQVMLPRFDDLNALMILSEELVAQTAELQQSLPGSKATILWLETWKKSFSGLPKQSRAKTRIANDLVSAIADYLRTQDESALLMLSSEERKLAREALGLDVVTTTPE
jgi:hypothetical protein